MDSPNMGSPNSPPWKGEGKFLYHQFGADNIY